MKIADGILEYEDPRFVFGSHCACRLRVWKLADHFALVMATELENPPGASVTNTAESWAEAACRNYGLNPARTIFVENYDRRQSDEDPSFARESFDFVGFNWSEDHAYRPRWKCATRESIELLLGEKLP